MSGSINSSIISQVLQNSSTQNQDQSYKYIYIYIPDFKQQSRLTQIMSASKRVLLTGANGYLAQHILSQFLKAGHSVRSVVRSQTRAG
jgi:hypothetical protein